MSLKSRRSNIKSVGRREPRGDARRYAIWQFMFPGFPFTPRPIPREHDVRGGFSRRREKFPTRKPNGEPKQTKQAEVGKTD